jgi:predicted  nucleic acid-binding Zn-ribbon protein
MSTTNENILKSLAVLEQNLKDINSAKEQVNSVVKSSSDLAKVIESYKSTFESLSINVKAVLEDSKKYNNDSIKKLSEQTTNFGKEITKLTEFDVSKSLKSIEGETIKQFQRNLSKPLADLDKQIKNIEREVAKLTEFDFKNSFSNIEIQVVNQFKADLKEKLNILDNKAIDLQSKIDEFKFQISRIENVDIESNFNNILTVLTTHYEKQSVELSRKYDNFMIKSEEIALILNRQKNENKVLKGLLLLIIGLIICVILLQIL